MCHYKFCINFYKFYILDNIYLFGHMKNSKRHILTSTRPATTKFGRVVT